MDIDKMGNLRSFRTKLLKYDGIKGILNKNGIELLLDFVISQFLIAVSKRCYRISNTDYGLSEAFSYPRDIDQWRRYMHVANEIRKTDVKKFSVLDVGSCGNGIYHFLNQLGVDCNSFLFDIKKDSFNDSKVGHPVVGDGCMLPFRNKAFDIVVSIDTIEHIPSSIRHKFYEELKRVCKRKSILTCPLQSKDGFFQGKNYDFTFQHLYEKMFGIKDLNTAQHIAAGHPTLEEILCAFPNATIQGFKNCDVWLKYVLFSYKLVIGIFCGLIYCFFWKKNDDKPPFWGAMIVSNYD